MPKIDITKTELVWPGKYNEDGTLKEVPRVNLPFQVIETVNESRATREAKKRGVQGSLFDFYEGKEGETFEEGWKNELVWGDKSEHEWCSKAPRPVAATMMFGYARQALQAPDDGCPSAHSVLISQGRPRHPLLPRHRPTSCPR